MSKHYKHFHTEEKHLFTLPYLMLNLIILFSEYLLKQSFLRITFNLIIWYGPKQKHFLLSNLIESSSTNFYWVKSFKAC